MPSPVSPAPPSDESSRLEDIDRKHSAEAVTNDADHSAPFCRMPSYGNAPSDAISKESFKLNLYKLKAQVDLISRTSESSFKKAAFLLVTTIIVAAIGLIFHPLLVVALVIVVAGLVFAIKTLYENTKAIDKERELYKWIAIAKNEIPDEINQKIQELIDAGEITKDDYEDDILPALKENTLIALEEPSKLGSELIALHQNLIEIRQKIASMDLNSLDETIKIIENDAQFNIQMKEMADKRIVILNNIDPKNLGLEIVFKQLLNELTESLSPLHQDNLHPLLIGDPQKKVLSLNERGTLIDQTSTALVELLHKVNKYLEENLIFIEHTPHVDPQLGNELDRLKALQKNIEKELGVLPSKKEDLLLRSEPIKSAVTVTLFTEEIA
jgi:hypothetical protein